MFGKELLIDLHGCNAGLFNEKDIDQYLAKLCELIDMERVGSPNCWYYDGEHEYLKGISVMQFIKTSSIVIHACDKPATLYVDIFSCKDFEEQDALEFTERYFGGESVHCEVVDRI
jgi:S-adenosylmethionine decarboxylase